MKVELGNPRKKTTKNGVRYLVFNARVIHAPDNYVVFSGLRIFKGVLHPSKNKSGSSYFQCIWLSPLVAGLIYDEVVFQEFAEQAEIKLAGKEAAIRMLLSEPETIDSLFNEDDQG